MYKRQYCDLNANLKKQYELFLVTFLKCGQHTHFTIYTQKQKQSAELFTILISNLTPKPPNNNHLKLHIDYVQITN